MPGAGVKIHFPGKFSHGQRPRLQGRLARVTFREFRLFRCSVHGGEKFGKSVGNKPKLIFRGGLNFFRPRFGTACLGKGLPDLRLFGNFLSCLSRCDLL